MAHDIGVDASGNVFVTGGSFGRARRSFLAFLSSYDYVTIKYNADGVQQWVQRYNGNLSSDVANALALDASGNVYVTGGSYSRGHGLECVTIKYSNDGALLWLQSYSGPAQRDDAANDIVVDANGNAYVTGYSYNSSGVADILTIKYDPLGAQQWANVYDAGPGTQDVGRVMAMDRFGNIYVAAETSVPGVVNSDFLTLRYDPSGALAWAIRYNGPENGYESPTAIAVVNPGRLEDLSPASIYVTGHTGLDVATVKYSQSPPIIFLKPQPQTTADEQVHQFEVSHFPNPANSFARFTYQLPYDARVSLNIVDGMGRKLMTVVDGYRKAGSYSATIDAVSLPAGVYYYNFVATGNGREFRKTNALVIRR
jgi:hypothetical protein